MNFLTYISLFVVTLVTFMFLFIKRRYAYWSNKGIIYAKPSFPYGNFKGVNRTRQLIEVFQELYNQFKGKGKFGGAYLVFSPILILLDLDLIRQIFIKDFNYFMDRGFYCNEKDDPLSAHLFLLEGEKWKNLRMKLTPTFTSGKMKIMFPTIVDVGNHLENVLSNMIHQNSEIIEVKDVVARFTTDVIGSCVFGIECNSLKDPNVEFRKIGKKFFTERRHSQIVELIINTYPNVAKAMGLKLTTDEIEEFYTRIVRETIDYREKNKIVRNDFMQLLIELKNSENSMGEKLLTFNECVAQAFIFQFAGFETSSTVMSFCLYELALNPEIQNKLRSEIIEVLKKYDQKLTYDAVKEMSYLRMVVNETLRKYPPVGNLVRKALKDYQIPESSQIIEKGILVFIPVYPIHHDPDIYEEPEKFNPERFSTENVQKRHPFSFLPFGEGPRNCIGLRFGKMQTYIGLITLILNFKFTKCSKTEIPLKINPKSPLLSTNEIFLNVEKI